MGCIALVRCVLMLRCGLAGVLGSLINLLSHSGGRLSLLCSSVTVHDSVVQQTTVSSGVCTRSGLVHPNYT